MCIEINYQPNSIILSQWKYIFELLQHDGLTDFKPVPSPMTMNANLAIDKNKALHKHVHSR